MASFHRQYYSPNHDVGCRLTIEDDVYLLLQEFVVYLQLQTGRLTFPSHPPPLAVPNRQITKSATGEIMRSGYRLASRDGLSLSRLVSLSRSHPIVS